MFAYKEALKNLRTQNTKFLVGYYGESSFYYDLCDPFYDNSWIDTNENTFDNDDQFLREFTHFCIINQPERSKREDHESGCGALNSSDKLERDK